ncbi:MAG: hypothetical protein LBU70_10385 [Chitinispirillales bacterium]|nr:hypothetical protein [Chitinispirillales bacterium]
MIKEVSGDGVVCATDKNRVLIAPIDADTKPASPKKGCGKGGCGGGSCGGCFSADAIADGYMGRFYIQVSGVNCFKPGDLVRFSRFIPEPNLVSLLVFGLPITFAITALLLWFINAPHSIESPKAFITVAAAFFGGFVVVGIIDKLFKTRYPAAIIEASGDSAPAAKGRP